MVKTVKVIKCFCDKNDHTRHEVGDVLSVTKAREKELIAARVVEAVPLEKETAEEAVSASGETSTEDESIENETSELGEKETAEEAADTSEDTQEDGTVDTTKKK